MHCGTDPISSFIEHNLSQPWCITKLYSLYEEEGREKANKQKTKQNKTKQNDKQKQKQKIQKKTNQKKKKRFCKLSSMVQNRKFYSVIPNFENSGFFFMFCFCFCFCLFFVCLFLFFVLFFVLLVYLLFFLFFFLIFERNVTFMQVCYWNVTANKEKACTPLNMF